ncbi:hypothetical protein B0T42_18695, partial [Rathayibacter sp. VKM Ac-2630]
MAAPLVSCDEPSAALAMPAVRAGVASARACAPVATCCAPPASRSISATWPCAWAFAARVSSPSGSSRASTSAMRAGSSPDSCRLASMPPRIAGTLSATCCEAAPTASACAARAESPAATWAAPSA